MRRLFHDRSGTSAVEFAVALPALILLFTGGFQLSDAVSVYRKVTITTRSLADLTSQFTTVNDTTLDRILNASQQVMAPYSNAEVALVVSQVTTNVLGQTKVDWSRGKNTNPLAKGESYVLPPALALANSSAIVARVTYTYRPFFGSSYIGRIPMGDTIVMLPRATDSITKE